MKYDMIAMMGVVAAMLTALLALILPKLRQVYTVPEGYAGLLYHKGRFVRMLAPGLFPLVTVQRAIEGGAEVAHKLEKLKRGNLKPETGDLRPETGDLRPETGDLRPETGDLRPETETMEDRGWVYQGLRSPRN